MPDCGIALFRAHPGLVDRFPRCAFTDLPTPVEPLPLDGSTSLYVKRDDRSGRLIGGNKPRKLEFIAGRALARDSRRLITTGGIGTHHGLATTILGREVGLATTLVLLHQPVTEEVRRSLLLFGAWGAQLVYGGNVPGTAFQGVRALLASWLRGERPTVVSAGGSSIPGNLGFVSAAFDLAEQVRAGELPEPAEIYLPVGTGGTLAGLAAGLRLAGLSSRVVGVLVTDILPPSPLGLARAARRVIATLRRADGSVPGAAIGAGDFSLIRDQLGPGYGWVTAAAREAVAEARHCGLELETTYSGKCLAALLARSRSGALAQGTSLFWNTFSSVDVTRNAPFALDPAALPPRFRRFFDEGDAR